MLFCQHGANEANQCAAVGEDAHDVGAPADLLLSRSWGLLDQIWRQICLEKAVNASRSARAASRCSAVLGSLSSNASIIRSYCAATDSESGWSNNECSNVLTHGQDAFGVTAMRFVV